jgi:hypothetical protein
MSGDVITENDFDSRKYPWKLQALVVTPQKIEYHMNVQPHLYRSPGQHCLIFHSSSLRLPSEFLVHIVRAYAVDSSHAASFALLDQTDSHNIQSCNKSTYIQVIGMHFSSSCMLVNIILLFYIKIQTLIIINIIWFVMYLLCLPLNRTE